MKEEIEDEGKRIKESAEEIVERVAWEEEMIRKNNEAAERMEKANKNMEENLNRRERILEKERFGGRAEAGGKEKTQEEKDIDDARKLLKGTGFEERLFPRGK